MCEQEVALCTGLGGAWFASFAILRKRPSLWRRWHAFPKHLLIIVCSRYGRKINSGEKKKVLERLYVPDEEEEDADIEVEDDDVVEKELKKLDAGGLGKLKHMLDLKCMFNTDFV